MQKLFTFSAESIALSPEVEALLRSKNAIFMDFGSSAYVRSEGMPALIWELMSGNQRLQSLHAQTMDTENETMRTQLEKLNIEINGLAARLETKEREVHSLQKTVDESSKSISDLRAENLRLVTLSHAQDQKPSAYSENRAEQEGYEKLQRAFETLRSQNIEAITSLKVLEDENDHLQRELESLRSQVKATCKT
jgi:predicted  nucleic acid-binding Zn-ribbon protein